MRILIVATMIAALGVGACQKKAAGQTVAVVNGDEITSQELNEVLSQDQSLAGANTKEARIAALQKLIDRKLLVQQARSDGLDKSPEFISQQRRGTEDLLISMLVSRKLNTAQVPSPAEINRFQASRPEMFANRETWSLSQIVYPLPVSKDIPVKLAAAKTLDEVASVLTAAGIKYTRASRELDTAVIPHAIYSQIAGLAPGEPFVAPGPGKAVASSIVARKPQPLTGDQARQLALASMKRDQASSFAQDRIKNLKATAKIEYQPGFEPPKK